MIQLAGSPSLPDRILMTAAFNTLQSRLHETILSNKIYVDKTGAFFDFIHFLERLPRLHCANVCLLIRPHGFALSLGTEIIAALLERDELLCDVLRQHEGIGELPECPAIRISFSPSTARTAAEFSAELVELMQRQLWEHHIESAISSYEDPRSYFFSLIRCIADRRGQAVAVIIDNYDIPFLTARAMDAPERDLALSTYLDMLNAMRHGGECVRWCLLAGHIKFPLATEFSEGLPLITDLSYSTACDTLFGFTREEVKTAFGSTIRSYAPRHGLTPRELLLALEACYGGMSFSDRRLRLFCPLAVDAAFANEGLLCAYDAAGHYGFLSEVIAAQKHRLEWLFDRRDHEAHFSGTISLLPESKEEFAALLMQQGFLTVDQINRIESRDRVEWRYSFRVPNIGHLRTLKVLLGLAAPELLTAPINPQVFLQGEHDYDLGAEQSRSCGILDEHCIF